MRVLYIGPDVGTCRQRRQALERLGHDVFLADPFAALPAPQLSAPWAVHTGALGLSAIVRRRVLARVGGREFDVALVDSGCLVGPGLVRALKQRARRVINYNPDNPFVARDGRRWRLFHQALPEYDLYITPRWSSALAALGVGAARVLQTDFAADETAHRPRDLSAEARARFAADVVFVGTWMPERGAFFAKLIQAGLPLRIFGPRWTRAPEYRVLQAHVTEGELDAEAYAHAICGAKIAIGLLSKGNEDLHTTRSLEIPAFGVLLCAERSDDHSAMYRDGEEAVFWNWDDAQECAEKCLELLKHPERIAEIAAAGLRRVRANRSFNEPLMAGFLAEAMRSGQERGGGELVAHPTLVNRSAFEAANIRSLRRRVQG